MSLNDSFAYLKAVFKETSLRFVLIVPLIIISGLVSINILYIYPAFKQVLTQKTETDAIRVGQQLSPQFKPHLLDGADEPVFAQQAADLARLLSEFGLYKLKVFNNSGKTILSSDEKDIGNINTNAYFHQIVAQGNPFTKVVKKNQKSLEGETIKKDIVETYVPILSNNTFLGAFEIYYDVTTSMSAMDRQFKISTGLLLGLSVLFMIMVLVPLKRMTLNTIQKKKAQKALFESEKNLAGLVNSVNGIILRFDRDGTITFMNQYGLDFFHYASDEILGRHISKIIDLPGPRPSLNTATFLEDIFQNPAKHLIRENENVLKSGQKKWIAWTNSPIVDETGQVQEILSVGMDITDRRSAELQLKKMHQNTMQMLESMPFGVIVVGRDRIIRSVNKAALKMMELEDENAIIGQICHNRICPAAECECPVLDHGHSIDSTERILLGKNKKEIPIMKTVLSINLGGEDVLLEAFVDITQINTAKREIEQANEKLKQSLKTAEQLKAAAQSANKAKSRFLANMSHEIRTPMNGVIGMAEILKTTPLDDIQEEYVNNLITSGNSLLSVINDVLDHSKIEEGKLELEEIDFDINVTLDELSDIVGPMAESKGLEYINHISPDIPSLVKGDPGRLRQVLINFVGNAIKFTHKGEIVTRITVQKEDDHHLTLFFSIKDTGIGIPKDQQDRLFKPFSQADTSTTRKYGGTGLGLIISKQLIKKMNGQVGVNSEVNKGTEFWFTAAFKKQTKTAKQAIGLSNDIRGKNILIVDDNKTNRTVLKEALAYWDCRYDDASNALEAMEKLEAGIRSDTPFEIAILDMHMPEMSGAQLGEQIKKNKMFDPLKLVIMTSIGQKGDAQTLETIGFDAYLIKPVKQSKLLSCLKVLSAAQSDSSAPKPKKILTRHSIAEIEKGQVRILLAEDNKMNQKVALTLIRKMGYTVDLANDGQEALARLKTGSYTMVFMDCQMPNLDGFGATRLIRDKSSRLENPDIPVIAMTANALHGDREKCLNAGMDDYLSKPVKPRQIAEMIKKWSKK